MATLGGQSPILDVSSSHSSCLYLPTWFFKPTNNFKKNEDRGWKVLPNFVQIVVVFDEKSANTGQLL